MCDVARLSNSKIFCCDYMFACAISQFQAYVKYHTCEISVKCTVVNVLTATRCREMSLITLQTSNGRHYFVKNGTTCNEMSNRIICSV